MKQAVARYIVSFQAEPVRKGMRYHWMICKAQNPRRISVLALRKNWLRRQHRTK